MRKKFLFNRLSLIFMAGLGLAAPKLLGTTLTESEVSEITEVNDVAENKALRFVAPQSVVSAGFGASPCGNPVNWHNLSDTGCGSFTNPGITQNVVDRDIDVNGVNALVGGIHVEAITCDITISVTNGDAVITGSGNRCDGVATTPAELYLFAAPGRTITFNLVDNLVFSGTAHGATKLDLLVTASGGGNINFIIGDGESVSFTARNAGSGGTFFIEGMSGSAPTLVTFSNSLVVGTPEEPAQVIVGPGSFIGFAAQTGDSAARAELQFQSRTSNFSDSILLMLVLQAGGGFNIGGFSADLTNPNFTIGSIDFTTQSGFEAIVATQNITGGGTGAAFQIVNSNEVDCQQLLINSFCQNAPFTGATSGFVLTGPTGVLTVNDQTYIAYVGTATNTCCTFTLLDECSLPRMEQRLRNGSAFIVDATDDASPATINLLGSSAIYFLSGVDNCGMVSADFTINTSLFTRGAGNILLDVEGPLNVFGSSPDETGLEILSLQVDAIGCPVTVDSTLSDNNFPKRTFARQPNGEYIQYNRGCFLINNRMSLFSTSLIHTDTIHRVFEHENLGNPNLRSDPTYIGGDSYLFPCHAGRPRPTISFVNSDFRVHSSVASTGVDFLFPNEPLIGNNSNLIFYNNGRCIDKGYGRNMILGTDPCFEPCTTSTGLDSHLNVFQENAQDATNLTLNILTSYNNNCITENIPSVASIQGQNAVQTIFLNNASNFSIGTNGNFGVDEDGNQFALTVTANVLLNGACLSFDTRGGTLAFPQSVSTTGEGGIFVDALGVLRLLNNRIASFGTMVTKSRSGIVDLPSNQAFFEPRVGIAEWQPDLSDPAQRLIVGPRDRLSDYTLDWGAAKKAFCCDDLITSTSCFIPYDVEEVPAPCHCPAVTQNNLVNLPTVQGEVDQMQILRSRMCDFVHLLVDGGAISELIFLHGFNTGEGPFGFIVLQNDGRVGLGTAHKDVDSLEASIVLGVNGVMLVANGDGNIELNEDIIINNVCHILSGTAFGVNLAPQRLSISSTTPKELRIKSGGTLDLTQFDNPFKILELTGQVKLVCEPNSRIIMNGGILQFSGQAQWFLEPEFDTTLARFPAVDVRSTDDLRVKLSGSGIINMIEDSSMFLPLNSFFGVETFPTCSTITNILFSLEDASSIQIGNASNPGGAFQVGDTVAGSIEFPRSVSFQLALNGASSLFEINRQGFFGLDVGIVQKLANDNPNDWLVSCLNNVTSCTIEVNFGTFQHNQISSGINPEASLFAIGSSGLYTFNFTPLTTNILGGGNLVKINCTTIDNLTRAINPTSVHPTVTSFFGQSADGFVNAAIMAGEFLLLDGAKDAEPVLVSPLMLFNYLSTTNYNSQAAPKGNIASVSSLNQATVGYVRDGTIIRRDVLNNGTLLGCDGLTRVSFVNSLNVGAVSIRLNDLSQNLQTVREIIGAGAF